MRYNKTNLILAAGAFFFGASSFGQCPVITCPSVVSVSVDAGTCGAVVNYALPTATDGCAPASSPANILFVCDADNTTATEIPAELVAAGYAVTEVYSDFSGGNNTVLQGSLVGYDCIFWHASGDGYGSIHNAATFTNLSSFVNAGGNIFITGYDVIASPNDPELIAFMGGTSSTDGGSQGTETLVGANSLTTGVTNTAGLVLNSTGDHDGLNGLQPGTIAVASNGGSHGWTIRTLGAGEIAWVSSANYIGQPWPAWNTPGSGYQEALLNFAFNSSSTNEPIVSLNSGLAAGATFPVGTSTVTYEATDYLGANPVTCSFTVTVVDDEAAVADVATLGDISECATSTPVAPTATDNCTGAITGTPDVTFPITSSGLTVVTWTYDDGNGNISTQTQNVTIEDVEVPVADIATLTDLLECPSYTPVAPTATDNCSGTITGTPDVTFPITASGLTVVTWTYDDGNGNTETQTQNITIEDNDPAVADVATLADVVDCVSSSPVAPTATDACSGTVTGTPDVALPITASGLTVVTWTYDDGNGNVSTQTQNVTVNTVDIGVSQAGAVLTADATGATYQWLDCDNSNSEIAGETNATFTATATTGNYAVVVTENGCSDTSACFLVDFTSVSEYSNNNVTVFPNPANGEFNVSIEGVNENTVTLLILDLQGKVIINEVVAITNGVALQNVNISETESGIYIVRIIGDKGVIFAQKITKL